MKVLDLLDDHNIVFNGYTMSSDLIHDIDIRYNTKSVDSFVNELNHEYKQYQHECERYLDTYFKRLKINEF